MQVPQDVSTLVPDVLGLFGGHVHVQVTHIGLLRVRLQTLPNPVLLGARHKGV